VRLPTNDCTAHFPSHRRRANLGPMVMPPNMFTVSGAAEALERDRATVQRCLRDTKPDLVEGKRQFYKLKTIFNAVLRHEMRTTGGPGRSVTDEHTALARARREKVELEVATIKGELVSAETMANLLELEYRVITERLLSIAAVVGDRIEPSDVARREFARQVIDGAVREVLLELSAPADLLEQSVDGRDRRRIGDVGVREGE
jgi:phage terminase Nu1 subunit (DNA packaging protein)